MGVGLRLRELIETRLYPRALLRLEPDALEETLSRLAGRELVPAARSVVEALQSVERRPIPVLDAVLGWVSAESRRFRPSAPERPLRLRFRAADVALAALAAAALAVLFH